VIIFNAPEEAHGRLRHPVCAVGNFDGVHAGHRAVFDEVIIRAAERGADDCIITFRTHPKRSLHGENLRILTTLDEKLELLEGLGIRHVLLMDFTPGFALKTPGEFLHELLVDSLSSSALVAGYDHAFGHNREGTVDHLRAIAAGRLQIYQTGSLLSGGAPVSSSRIRNLLDDGAVDEASVLLGRDYAIGGTVVEGKRRGRTIGFPTANLLPEAPEKMVPGDGVYAARVSVKGSVYPAAVSVGSNTTFGPGERTIEAHILDFSGDIYGERIRLAFARKLREQMTFATKEALIAAIAADCAAVRGLFGENGQVS
jgi:riboflavin kinase / FMN adenylyltransferase